MPRKFKLYKHQYDFRDSLLQDKKLLLGHPTGSGKTLTSLATFKFLKDSGKAYRALVLLPASLKDNFADTIKSFNFAYTYTVIENVNDFKSKNDVLIMSFAFARNHIEEVKNIDFDFLIVDEFHVAKNDRSKIYDTIMYLMKKAEYGIALSASPFQNTPGQFLALIDLLTDGSVGKEARKYVKVWKPTFLKKVVRLGRFFQIQNRSSNDEVEPTIEVTNPDKFKELVSPYLKYVDPKEIETITGRPRENIKYVDVKMNALQTKLYLAALNKVNRRWLKNLKKNKLAERDLTTVFNQLLAARQTLIDPNYMLSDYDVQLALKSAKLKQLSKDIKDVLEKNPKHFCIVFTNFVGFGAKAIRNVLKEDGISSSVYYGKLDRKQRTTMLDNFRNGKIKVLVMTSAGALGLDFPFVSHVYILDPHYNPEMMRQMRSRAVRAGSIWSEIGITIYRAVPSFGTMLFRGLVIERESVDHWILNIADRKIANNMLLKQVLTGLPKDMLTESSNFLSNLKILNNVSLNEW